MRQFIKNSEVVLIVIFLEGFVSISVEILAIRQLIPVAGTSIIVTSLIIGVFLLFLAIGYWKGGLYRENFISILKRNFIIAAGLIGIGVSYPFIAYFFVVFERYVMTSNFLFILICYLLLVIAPIIYLIGQTVPLTMNLMNPEKRSAETGGKVLFLSTFGSFLGAPLTSLFFMEFLGVAWTIFINFFILTVMAFLFAKKHVERFIYVVLTIIIGWSVYELNVSFEKDHFVATTNYANYSVNDNGVALDSGWRGRILESNNAFSSFINDKKKTFLYNELIKRILFKDLKMHDAQILVLGAGGFTLSAEDTHGNYFTYVDIDPKIKSIVEKNFLPKINGKFIAQDARIYLAKHIGQYDVIVSDVCSNLFSIPPSLLTLEYFSSIRASLKTNGFAIFNIVSRPFLNDPYSKRVDSTIRSIFGNCISSPLHYSDKPTNIVYVCRVSRNAYDKTIYTDNLNTVELDFIALQRGAYSNVLRILNKKSSFMKR